MYIYIYNYINTIRLSPSTASLHASSSRARILRAAVPESAPAPDLAAFFKALNLWCGDSSS